MREHFTDLTRLLEQGGVDAYAAADIGAWGAALGQHERRRMVGLQVANSHWILLPESMGAELDPPVKTRFHEIGTPISAVVGGRDFDATRRWAERIAARAPRVTLTVIPEADHFPMLSAPEAFERIVRQALDSASR